MTQTIAWIDGRWGDPDELNLPLTDRGLQLADGLFETVLVNHGKPWLLKEHLSRWHDGAHLLGMQPPPEERLLLPLIIEAMRRIDLAQGCGALRLNWSRGSGKGRGIGIPIGSSHRFWLTLQVITTAFTPIKTIISRFERRNVTSRLSRCKSFAYGQAIQARREAGQVGGDDALLRNTDGELCCGTAANLLVHRHGEWLTPPLESGCLPGVMRARALQQHICREAWLGTTLRETDQAVLINSLSCRPVVLVDHRPLQPCNGDDLFAEILGSGHRHP